MYAASGKLRQESTSRTIKTGHAGGGFLAPSFLTSAFIWPMDHVRPKAAAMAKDSGTSAHEVVGKRKRSQNQHACLD